jgi:hypothetical protein
MARVSLITGDLDFLPSLDSIVKLGTYVTVMYEPKSAARGLYAAADGAYPIGFMDVYSWLLIRSFLIACLKAVKHGGEQLGESVRNPYRVGI